MKRRLDIVVFMVVAGAGTLSAESSPRFSGFVDMGYSHNLEGRRANTLRGFDDRANTITLQNAEIVAEGKVENGPGYRIDVDYGYDATKTQAAGFVIAGSSTVAGDKPQVDVQQAYLTTHCPWTGSLITVGKFVTAHGAEVIEAKDNANISRGFLFNYAIPFTHTGIKADKTFVDGKWGVSLGLVNGWDNSQDNNKGKSFHGTVTAAPNARWSVAVGGTYGPEQADPAGGPSVEGNARGLVDALIKYAPTSRLSLAANADWGSEEGFSATNPDNPTQNWLGGALYAAYAWTDTWSTALRFETFDDDGSRVGLSTLMSDAGLTGPADGVVFKSHTLTLQKKQGGVLARLEFRRDWASKEIFLDDNGGSQKTQDTLGVQLIYAY